MNIKTLITSLSIMLFIAQSATSLEVAVTGGNPNDRGLSAQIDALKIEQKKIFDEMNQLRQDADRNFTNISTVTNNLSGIQNSLTTISQQISNLSNRITALENKPSTTVYSWKSTGRTVSTGCMQTPQTFAPSVTLGTICSTKGAQAYHGVSRRTCSNRRETSSNSATIATCQ